MIKYGLFWGALALSAGIYIGNKTEIFLVGAIFLALSSVLALGWYAYQGKRRTAFFCAVLFACFIGMCRIGWAEAIWKSQSAFMVGSRGTYMAIVKEAPYVSEENGYVRYLTELEKVYFSDGVEKTLRGAIYIYSDDTSSVFQTGDRISVTGQLRPVTIYRNPGKIDFKNRYKREHIIGKLYLKKNKDIEFIGKSGQYTLTAWAENVKENIRHRFSPYMDSVRLQVLMTLLFGGNYEKIPVSWIQSFSVTGIIHILSVSGSHIALLFAFLYFLGRVFHLPLRAVLPFSLFLVGGYAALSGFVAPVLRASIMGLLSAGGLFFERDKTALNLLGAAVCFLLLWEPLFLYDVSFQLSVTASAGLLLFYKPFARVLKKVRYVPDRLAEGVALSCAAQILTVPIVLYDFHVLPTYFIVSNIIILPFLEVTIIIGLMAAVSVVLFSPLVAGLLYIADYLLWCGIHFNVGIASWRGASWLLGGMNGWQIWTYYLCIGLFLGRKYILGDKLKIIGVGVIFLLSFSMAVATRFLRTDMRVLLPDIGNDQAVVLVSESQNIIYYKNKGFSPQSGLRELQSFLEYEGLFSIHTLILNLEESQKGGKATFSLPTKEVWVVGGKPGWKSWLTISPDVVKNIRQSRLKCGDWIVETNGSSFFFRNGKGAIYLAGGKEWWPQKGGSAVLWIGGSDFSGNVTETFLRRCRPEMAVYTGGRLGEWGESYEAFHLYDCPLYDTRTDGVIVAGFTGKTWKLEK